MAVTVIIPTLNEEVHIIRAVESAKLLGAVWVVDSGSSDATWSLAESAGARVVHRTWLGHASQKNWALDNLPIDTQFVMFLDADEVIPPDLRAEIQAVTANTSEVVAYYMPRRNIFMGRPLDHAWWYPDYQMRLFIRGRARYEEREVHEHMEANGPSARLQSDLVHESLKGIDEFLERHVRYAKAEAAAISTGNHGRLNLRTRAGRRRAIKTRVWYRARQRPLIRFLWLYIVKRGFRDGPQGRIYCQLIAAYEAMIDAYCLEWQQAQEGPSHAEGRQQV